MHSSDKVRQLGSALLPRTVHLHGLATAAAMLTCVAVVLNVGPFARAPSFNDGPGSVGGQAEPATVERPDGSGSIARREFFDARTALHRAEAADVENMIEPTRALLQLSSFSVADNAPWVAQPPRPIEVAQSSSDHASPELVARDMVVGIWAPDAGTCSARNFRDGALPTIINAEGAWAGDTFCMFTDKKHTETGWRVVATCSNPRERWKSNVRLTVNENRLTWTSKRGTQAYTRCAPDVMIAEAR
jgi:hypothetical protein